MSDGAVPSDYAAEDTTRGHVLNLSRAVTGLQHWRAWMLGAIAVLTVVVTLAVASVPWMVRSAVQDVLIEHGILRVSKGE